MNEFPRPSFENPFVGGGRTVDIPPVDLADAMHSQESPRESNSSDSTYVPVLVAEAGRGGEGFAPDDPSRNLNAGSGSPERTHVAPPNYKATRAAFVAGMAGKAVVHGDGPNIPETTPDSSGDQTPQTDSDNATSGEQPSEPSEPAAGGPPEEPPTNTPPPASGEQPEGEDGGDDPIKIRLPVSAPGDKTSLVALNPALTDIERDRVLADKERAITVRHDHEKVVVIEPFDRSHVNLDPRITNTPPPTSGEQPEGDDSEGDDAAAAARFEGGSPTKMAAAALRSDLVEAGLVTDEPEEVPSLEEALRQNPDFGLFFSPPTQGEESPDSPQEETGQNPVEIVNPEATIMGPDLRQWNEKTEALMARGARVIVLRGAGTVNGIEPAAAQEATALLSEYVNDVTSDGRPVALMCDGDSHNPEKPDIGSVFGGLVDDLADNPLVTAVVAQSKGWYSPRTENGAIESASGRPYETYVFPDDTPGGHASLTQSDTLVAYPNYEQVFVGPAGPIAFNQLGDLSQKAAAQRPPEAGEVKVTVIATPNNPAVDGELHAQLGAAADEQVRAKVTAKLDQRAQQPYGALFTPTGEFSVDTNQFPGIEFAVRPAGGATN